MTQPVAGTPASPATTAQPGTGSDPSTASPPPATTTPPATPAAVVQPGTTATPAAPAAGDQLGPDGKPWDPTRVAKLVDGLRADKAATAAQLAQVQADADQRKRDEEARTDALAKLLGFKDETPDPVKLTKALQKETEDKRQALIDLAVYQSAEKHGAEPGAVLDSRTFATATRNLDPAAADFGTKVAAAIAAAVKDNPRLAKAPAASTATPAAPAAAGENTATPPAPAPTPGVSGAQITAGTGAKPITREDLAKMSPEAIAKAYDEGRLKHLV